MNLTRLQRTMLRRVHAVYEDVSAEHYRVYERSKKIAEKIMQLRMDEQALVKQALATRGKGLSYGVDERQAGEIMKAAPAEYPAYTNVLIAIADLEAQVASLEAQMTEMQPEVHASEKMMKALFQRAGLNPDDTGLLQQHFEQGGRGAVSAGMATVGAGQGRPLHLGGEG